MIGANRFDGGQNGRSPRNRICLADAGLAELVALPEVPQKLLPCTPGPASAAHGVDASAMISSCRSVSRHSAGINEALNSPLAASNTAR